MIIIIITNYFISGWYDVNRGRYSNHRRSARVRVWDCAANFVSRSFLHSIRLSETEKGDWESSNSHEMEDMDIPDLVDMAKLAEHAERFEDMAKYMKSKVQKDSNLSMDERSLLSVAFKNVIGSRRASWRTLQVQESKTEEGKTKGAIPLEITKEYKKKVETELTEIIDEVIELLDSKLILKKANDEITDEKEIETQIFYYKMKGDYCRYKAEYDKENDKIVSDGEAAYEKALELAEKLPSTNPTSLGLALNYSVFFYEIKNDGAKACSIAKKAFDDAVKDLDNAATESTYKDSTLIMQLLRDNLTLWTSEAEEDDQQDAERD
ncbi:PREDICTED: 14-3-3 protein zeta-like [Amphimedon queenslandica]|uniref:14-3-3 domain-containing protein n=1 Tax=Amphimedon queenslandica TaxID=400682 RepID=A0A1X7V3G8_AMPQE|nr:PREDICTED: 14-3-3 protein zeta-like [Amphimedon queenslandica]|eukprot:XP_011403333.2 PREDICTED: 14-3-3 protein zeta-like [Amphimedon queenslandica]